MKYFIIALDIDKAKSFCLFIINVRSSIFVKNPSSISVAGAVVPVNTVYVFSLIPLLLFSKELVTFGENLYAYSDSKSDNVILVDVELDYMIKLISKYLKGYSINRGLNNLDSTDTSEMKRMILVEKIKKLYEEVINVAIPKTTKSYNLSLK